MESSTNRKNIEVADKYLLIRIVVIQPPYNLLNRKIEEKLVLTCEKLGIGQVTYSPLAQGVLTGKYNHRNNIAQNSRAYNQTTQKFMGEYYQEHQLLKVEKLQELATHYNLYLTQTTLVHHQQVKQRLNLLKETVADDIEQLQISEDEDARIGHKSSDSSFFGYKTHMAMCEELIITSATVTTGKKMTASNYKR